MNVVYVDNKIDINLEKFLDQKGNQFSDDNYSFESITFDADEGYEKLLYDKDIINADVILIDSKLYEDEDTCEFMYTGEEFKLALTRIYPFKVIIVITQNKLEKGIEYISKSKCSKIQDIENDYTTRFENYFKDWKKRIVENQILQDKFYKNNAWEKMFKDKIVASVDGSNEYFSLTKSDIDYLVAELKKMGDKNDGRL